MTRAVALSLGLASAALFLGASLGGCGLFLGDLDFSLLPEAGANQVRRRYLLLG